MPLTSHREMHTKSGASRMYPTGPVRTVHTRPQAQGWLEVSASEFMRLLERHNEGEIDLLTMPEFAGDDVETDEPEEVEQPQEEQPVARGGHIKSDTHLARVLRCFASRETQLTQTQIAERCGLTKKQVKSAMEHNRGFFAVVKDGRTQDKLWKVK